MKARLMFKDRDFDPKAAPVAQAQTLTQDLELDLLFGAMANGDTYLQEVARSAVLADGALSTQAIAYRQEIITDCVRNRAIVRKIYAIALEAIERERKVYYVLFRNSPEATLRRSVEVLNAFLDLLMRLRLLAEESGRQFRSDGFGTLFRMLRDELDDGYFTEVRAHLNRLRFRDGIPVSAHLGAGNRAADYTLREPPIDRRIWPFSLFPRRTGGHALHIHPGDEAGAKALGELRGRALGLAAEAIGRAADQILDFFVMLRSELAFHIGAVNLHDALQGIGQPVTMPTAHDGLTTQLRFGGLVDVCLAISTGKPPRGNDVEAGGRALLVITGANRGGKSTFLRSIGIAQLMMQAGLFVAASHFEANIASGVHTHYRRQEDALMKSGKFDEELQRMSRVVAELRPRAMILFNESFAATNEREGAEVAGQIVRALLDSGMKVALVTHLYALARSLETVEAPATFLRAERLEDGSRSFRLVDGRPLETSFGEDLYSKVFKPQS